MKFLRLASKNREKDPNSWERLYETMIIRKIRARYTVDQELAIQRQRNKNPAKFEAYNAFAEQCKAEAKRELGIE